MKFSDEKNLCLSLFSDEFQSITNSSKLKNW